MTYVPRSFSELLEVVESYQGNSTSSWYRGCHDEGYKLVPTLYRHTKKKTIEELTKLEKEIAVRFSQRSQPFLQRPFSNDWDKLFLLQHYGVPAQLLDWTENPFVAIYFAINGEPTNRKSSASIWMCDPVAWNKAALDHISFSGGVLDESSEQLGPYSLGRSVEQLPLSPVMILRTYNSPRIVAQRGGFAIFGQSIDSMEAVYNTQEKFSAGVLEKIVIERDIIESMRDSLYRKGFKESVVFPDLDGLSKEIKRSFGF